MTQANFLQFTFLVSDINHPSTVALRDRIEKHELRNQMAIFDNLESLPKAGEILFLISVSNFLSLDVRNKFQETLVFHASDLPKGRGWSPYVWDIIGGKDRVFLSMIRAADAIDTGDIFAKVEIPVSQTDTYREINRMLNDELFNLVDQVMRDISVFEPRKQADIDVEPTYFPKRSPKDSQLDINLSIAEQFDLMRICDEERYPAFFVIDGVRFDLHLRKREN